MVSSQEMRRFFSEKYDSWQGTQRSSTASEMPVNKSCSHEPIASGQLLLSPPNYVPTAKDHQAFEKFFEVKGFLKDFLHSFFSIEESVTIKGEKKYILKNYYYYVQVLKYSENFYSIKTNKHKKNKPKGHKKEIFRKQSFEIEMRKIEGLEDEVEEIAHKTVQKKKVGK